MLRLTLFIILFNTNSLYAQFEIDTTNTATKPSKKVKTYDPLTAGIASYIFPGLGQLYCDEPIRAQKFYSAGFGGIGIMVLGFTMVIKSDGTDPLGATLVTTGASIYIVSCVWSIADAVKLANRKNKKQNPSLNDVTLGYKPITINGEVINTASLVYRF